MDPAAPPSPLLVFDRIDENRRRTRWLLALFAAIMVPFFAALALPLGYLVLFPAAAVSAPAGEGEFFRTWLVWLAGALGAAVGAAAGLAFVELRRATSWALRQAGARPVSAKDEPELWRAVENLCIGAGLATPSVYVAASGPPNAFAVGTEPESTGLVVTRGLLELVDRRELQGVIAHELSHIGNQDVRLNTVLAALVAALRLPYSMLGRVSRRLAGGCLVLSLAALILGIIGLGGMLVVAVIVVTTPELLQRAREGFATDPDLRLGLALELAIHFAWAAPAYLLVGGRALGLMVGRAVVREREFLADADAVLLTRDPEGLATALVKIEAARGGAAMPSLAMAHLYIVDPFADRPAGWREKLLSAHPSVEERIEVLGRLGAVSPEALRRAWAEAAEAPGTGEARESKA